MKNQLATILTLGVLGSVLVAPTMASADDFRPRERHHDLRNDWKAFSIGSAIVGLAGLASGDQNVAIAGAVGSVYSAYRLSTDEPHRRDWDDHRWEQHEWVRVHERERERDRDRERLRERARLAERERARFREFDREYRR